MSLSNSFLVQYIAYSVDLGLFYTACRDTVTALKALAVTDTTIE